MKIYLSGPMTGLPDRNRRAFDKQEQILLANGHTVLNPHRLITTVAHEGPCHGKSTGVIEDDHLYGCYLLHDIIALRECHAIMMLHGWMSSPGARAEHAYADACGMMILYEKD